MHGSRTDADGRDLDPTPTALVTSTPSDSHTWNLVFLQLLLEEHGYVVRNLGACPPISTIVAECRTARPDIVVVSSLNGHGRVEGAALISSLRAETELSDVPVVIGGMLTTGHDDRDAATELRVLGYSAVFVGVGAVPAFRAFLETIPRAGRRVPELSR